MKRKCTKCKKEKELNDKNFYRQFIYSGGYTPQCKECMIKRGKVYGKKQSDIDNWTKLFIG